MAIRLFFMTPEIRKAIRKIVQHAEKNRWRPTQEDGAADKELRPSKNKKRPGKDGQHVIRIGSYLCTFSITEKPEVVFKHLSVRTPEAPPDTAPQPAMVEQIAPEFGFTPDPRRWSYHHDDCRPACAVVIEPIEWKDKDEERKWNETLSERGVRA